MKLEKIMYVLWNVVFAFVMVGWFFNKLEIEAVILTLIWVFYSHWKYSEEQKNTQGP